jgi:cytochrome c-type biogenesis protein CcmH/NrfG
VRERDEGYYQANREKPTTSEFPGRHSSDEERCREASSVLRDAVARLPSNGFLARRLGVVLFLEGQFDDAAAAFRQAIQESPYGEAFMAPGEVYLLRREFGRALAALESAEKMQPSSASIQADLADAYS